MNEATARIKINTLLEAAGWRFFADGDRPANIQLAPSVTILIGSPGFLQKGHRSGPSPCPRIPTGKGARGDGLRGKGGCEGQGVDRGRGRGRLCSRVGKVAGKCQQSPVRRE